MMKKFISSSTSEPCTLKPFTCGFISQIMIKLSVLVLIAFSALNVSAQNAKELGNTLDSLMATADPNDYAVATHLKSLVYDIHPTVFIENNNILPISNANAIRVVTDINSIGLLSQQWARFSQVELILINVTDTDNLHVTLNLDNLPAFTNLTNILFLCDYNCPPATINNIFQPNIHVGLNVYYQIIIPN